MGGWLYSTWRPQLQLHASKLLGVFFGFWGKFGPSTVCLTAGVSLPSGRTSLCERSHQKKTSPALIRHKGCVGSGWILRCGRRDFTTPESYHCGNYFIFQRSYRKRSSSICAHVYQECVFTCVSLVASAFIWWKLSSFFDGLFVFFFLAMTLCVGTSAILLD